MAVDLPGMTTSNRARLARRAVLARRVRWFVAVTISYNVVEAIVAVTAGTVASSAALIGFGLDSLVEVTSAAAVAWQFAARDPETREKAALRIIAFSFFALAAYVTVDAVRSIVGVGEARPSTVGLALAAVSLAVMPVLSYGQRRAGRELGSRTAVADSKQTLLCTYLSAVLLVGLGLNAAFGWSWADPIAALVIAAVAVKEGREAWYGDTCCAPNLSVPCDTAMTDIAMTDTAVTDTAMTDTAMTDTAMTDTAMTDTAMTDTAMTDTAMTDTAVADACTDGCCAAPTTPGSVKTPWPRPTGTPTMPATTARTAPVGTTVTAAGMSTAVATPPPAGTGTPTG
jgi:Cation efflux family